MIFKQAIKVKNNWLLQKKEWTEKTFVVRQTFSFELEYWNKMSTVIIPEWFITDFGTVPRLIWFLFSPTKYISYILHDFLYWIWLDRKQADLALLDWLKGEWAWYIERILVYASVRCFWWINYNKK